MRPLIRIGRVRLSHVETTDATGQPAQISWEHISGWPRLCRPSSVAHLLHPGLPRSVYIHPGCSNHTVERLRERVIRRKFEAGTYDRFWPLTPPATPREFLLRVGGATLLALLAGLYITNKLTAAQIAHVDQQAASEFTQQFSHLTLMMVALVVGVIIFLGIAISLGRSCREPALAVRTTAPGFDRYLTSGAVRFTAWQDAAKQCEIEKRRRPYVLQICPEHGVKGGLADWIALRVFLDRKFITRKRRSKLAAQIREGTLAVLGAGLALSAILVPIIVARSYFPPEPTRGQRPATPAETAAIFSIMFSFFGTMIAWLLVDFVGLHRFRLRIRQAFQRAR